MKKKIIILSICVFLLSSSVYAGTTSKVGKKITAEAPVYLNGQLISDAIITEGSSFAPLRAIAEVLGLDVRYETSKEGSAIKLTSPEATKEMIWKKAELESKIKGAQSEIEYLNSLIVFLEKDIIESNHTMITEINEKSISKHQTEIIKQQQDIITYTNELLELESSK